MQTSVGSKSGFSLVELMVVVAIIGILATIAVPNFQRFQAKAKQSNAKVELAGIYTTEQAFFTEYQVYHGYLPGMGFLPDGINATTGMVVTNATRYYATSAGPVGTIAWPGTLPAIGSAGMTPYNNNTFPVSTTTCTPAAGLDVSGVSFGASGTPATGLTAQTFVAGAAGCPSSSTQASMDEWTINNNKVLSNTQAGI